MKKIMMGVNTINHLIHSNFYPQQGTIGTILEEDNEAKHYLVQWETGSTSGDDRWWVEARDVVILND